MITHNFYADSERRGLFVHCLSEFDNLLQSHSNDIKYFKKNNIKGVHEIVQVVINDMDTFMEIGSEMDITLKSTEDKKKKKGDRK